MRPDFDLLLVIAEIGIAFVAFSTIVAALQPIRGKKFTKYQILLVHFYIESGGLNVMLSLLPIILWHFLHDELLVWKLATLAIMLNSIIYLSSYIMRRRKVRAPTPSASLFVMIGYFIWTILLALTLTETFWQPSLAIIEAHLLWGLGSSGIIFVYYFGSFIRRSARG